MRVDKTDSDTGTTLPATTQEDRFTDTQVGFYVESKIQWAEKFRTVAALRGDVEHVDVTSLVTPTNSGTATKVLPSPNLSLIFGPWSKTEFYVQSGFDFHSNDARGATQTVQPVSDENPYPNTQASRIPLLIPTKGAEIGVRTAAHICKAPFRSGISAVPPNCSRVATPEALFRQHSRATATASNGRTTTRLWNMWLLILTWRTPEPSLLQSTKAMLRRTARAASGYRKRLGWWFHRASHCTITNAFRRVCACAPFGPRDLTSDGIFRSNVTVLLNADVGYQITTKWRFVVEFLNLLNRRDRDIDYAYESRITSTMDSAFTDVFHPVEPFQVRFGLRRTF